MTNTEKQVNNLKQYIQAIAEKLLENKMLSGVISGTVTKVINNSSYEVTPMGSVSSITAIPLRDKTFQLNDYVYMTYYEDGAETIYYIFDTIVSASQEFFNLTLEDRFKEDISINIVEDSSTSLLNWVLGADGEDENEYITKIVKSGCFKIEGQFNSDSTTSSDFGLQIDFFETQISASDSDSEGFRTVYLNPPYFLGQTSKLSDLVTQSRVITLAEDEKEKLASIRIITFGKNFSYKNVKISCGFLLNVESIFSVSLDVQNNKNYFSADEYKDTVTFKAKVTQDGSEVNSGGISYYWLVQDEAVSAEEKAKYPSFIEDGWRCLNRYEDTEKFIEGVSVDVRIWKRNSNELTIAELDDATAEEKRSYINSLFPKYLNKVKCIITYKDIVKESSTIDIYNYYQEQFSASLYASVSPAYIIHKDDSFTLNCKISNENPKLKKDDYKYQYTWKKQAEGGDVDITPKDIGGNPLNTNTLEIQGQDSAVAAGAAIYELNSPAENIYCEVSITDRNDIFVSLEKSNNIVIESRISEANPVISQKQFKYYISTNNMNVNFDHKMEKNEGEGVETLWSGDWTILDNEATPSWTDLKENSEQLAYNKLLGNNFVIFENFEDKNSNDVYYVYYTEQLIWQQMIGGSLTTIRTENWTEPQLARAVQYTGATDGWKNLKVGAAIEQINAFNKLTNNGVLEGIHFDGNNAAYVNASFINAGALRVGDKDNEKFYADIDNDNVKIAGFTVDENSLSASIPQGEEEDNFDIYLGEEGLKVGTFLQAGPNGASLSGDVSFVGSDDKEITLNELNNTIINYGERRDIIVYSASEAVPSNKPMRNSQTDETNIGQSYSNGTLWFETYDADHSYWMCQKYDTSIEDNENAPWGDIIQIASMQPYVLFTDNPFIAVPADSDGNIDKQIRYEILLSLQKGLNNYSFENFITTEHPNDDSEALVYEGANVDVEYDANNESFQVSNLSQENGRVDFYFYKFGKIQARTSVEIAKQKAGIDGSYIYAKANTYTINKYSDGSLKTKSINIKIYKKIGEQAPALDTSTYFIGIKNDNDSVLKWFSTSSGVYTYTFNTTNYAPPSSKMSIYISTVANTASAIDIIFLSVVEDGADGVSVESYEEYYAWNTSDTVAPTSGWTLVSEGGTLPSRGDNIYLWNKEVIKDPNGNTISETSPIIVYRYAKDGTDGKDGIDGEDGDSFGGVVEWYAYAPDKVWGRAAPKNSNVTANYYWGNDWSYQTYSDNGSGKWIKWTTNEVQINWTKKVLIPTEENPFVWNKEEIIFKDANGNIITSETKQYTNPQVIEHPRTVYYAYCTSSSKPSNLNPKFGTDEVQIGQDKGDGKWHSQPSNSSNWSIQRTSYGLNSKSAYSYNYDEWSDPVKMGRGEIGPSGRNPLQSIFYYVWSTSKINPPNTDTLIQDVTDNNYYVWSDDFSSITFQTHEEWAPKEQDPVYWALEEDLFTHWSGREVSTNAIASNSNLGDTTYVWKIQVTAYDDGTIGIWSSPILMPELEAIELAAKYQIKDNVYVNGFRYNNNLTYPLLGSTRDGNAYHYAKSITGLTIYSSFVRVPEGDIGRWCRLYDRTVMSGGALVTGSITADQIAANAITAEKIDVDDLHALEAKIGGWIIGETSLLAGEGLNQVGLSSDSQQQERIWAGDDDPAVAPFRVYETGEMYSSKGTIGGWTIEAHQLINSTNTVRLCSTSEETSLAMSAGNAGKNGKFTISTTREITIRYKASEDGLTWNYDTESIDNFGTDSNGAYISNTLDGTVDKYYYIGISTFNAVNYDTWQRKESSGATYTIYTNHIFEAVPPFALYNNGSLYAANATIEGTIIAKEGMIGGWNLEKDASANSFLYSKSSNNNTGLASVINNENPVFWAGYTGTENYPGNDSSWVDKTTFSVTNQGLLRASSAELGDWNITDVTIAEVTVDHDEGGKCRVIHSAAFQEKGFLLDQDKGLRLNFIQRGGGYLPLSHYGEVSGPTDTGRRVALTHQGISCSKRDLYDIDGRNDYVTAYYNIPWYKLGEAVHFFSNLFAYGTVGVTDGQWTKYGDWYYHKINVPYLNPGDCVINVTVIDAYNSEPLKTAELETMVYYCGANNIANNPIKKKGYYVGYRTNSPNVPQAAYLAWTAIKITDVNLFDVAAN